MLCLPPCVPVWGQPVPFAKIGADGGGLADIQIAVLKHRRRQVRRTDIFAREDAHQRRHAAAILFGQARNVHIRHAGVFEHQAHEFPAPLDGGPVVKPIVSVCHGRYPVCCRSSRRKRGRAKNDTGCAGRWQTVVWRASVTCPQQRAIATGRPGCPGTPRSGPGVWGG